jgi:hypothetical protein
LDPLRNDPLAVAQVPGKVPVDEEVENSTTRLRKPETGECAEIAELGKSVPRPTGALRRGQVTGGGSGQIGSGSTKLSRKGDQGSLKSGSIPQQNSGEREVLP